MKRDDEARVFLLLTAAAVLATWRVASAIGYLEWGVVGSGVGALAALRRRRWALRVLPAWLCVSFNRLGVEFEYKGDQVIWTWPWLCPEVRALRGPWISLGFTGSGEFGDARFRRLAHLDEQWRQYFEAEREIADRFGEHFGMPPGSIPPFDPRRQEGERP